MPKTLQIRDLDDALARRASREGVSVPELVRQELTRSASLLCALERLEMV